MVEMVVKVGNSLKELTTIDNYGDYLNYGIDLNGDNDTTNDWKIFYKDKNGEIFIIAAQCLDESIVPKELTGLRKYGNESGYEVRWDSDALPAFQTNWSKNAELFMGSTYTLKGEYKNSKCVSTLLNTDNWNDFVKIDYADFAIGGPSLDMWCDSWNQKKYKTKLETTIHTYGYQVNNNDSVDLKLDSGYKETLYFPGQNYWLAAPSEVYVSGNSYGGSMCAVTASRKGGLVRDCGIWIWGSPSCTFKSGR